jgi:hypothetical protein
LGLFSFQPSTDNTNPYPVVVVEIPENIKLEVAYGYGPYFASSLYGLAAQEHRTQLITQTIQQELGIPIDGYIVSRFPSVNETGFAVPNLTRKWWITPIETDISLGDRWKLWWQTRNLISPKILNLNFADGNWAKQSRELDGYSSVEFDKNTVDSRLPQLISDALMRESGLSVRVVNTTTISGMGSQAARIVTGSGLRVVEIKDQAGILDKCILVASQSLQYSYPVKRLMRIFGCKLAETTQDDPRVDIELHIGKELAEIWKGN